MPPIGISIHIGLNYVDPNRYEGWDGKLLGAEYDAIDMARIADAKDYHYKTLLREEATYSNVKYEIERVTSDLKAGDIFLLSFSGHGGLMPNLNDDQEESGKNQTWCLYDRQIIDNELYKLWFKFSPGVRVLVISDSCHSGTVIKLTQDSKLIFRETGVAKRIPSSILSKNYLANQEIYDKILKDKNYVQPEDIKASIKLISACQDNQYAYDNTYNGVFTEALKAVWGSGNFYGKYSDFCEAIRLKIENPNQLPNYYNVGKENTNFNNQTQPFAI